MPVIVKTKWQTCTTTVPILGGYRIEFHDYEATVPDEVADWLVAQAGGRFWVVDNVPVSESKRILVFRDNGLGDILMTTAAIRKMKQSGVEHIAFMTQDRYAVLMQGNPYIDEIVPLVDNVSSPEFRKKWDRVVNLRLHFENLEHHRLFQNRAVVVGQACGVVLTEDDLHLDYFITDQERDWANGVVNEPKDDRARKFIEDKAKGRNVAFVWGASCNNRTWSEKHALGMINTLLGNNFRPVIINHEYVDMHTVDHRILNMTGKTSIRESIALLGACDVVLTPDTGLFHAAAALDKNVVTYFGAMAADERRTHKKLTVINKGPEHGVMCYPCRKYFCMNRSNDGTPACIDINPSIIIDALKYYTG